MKKGCFVKLIIALTIITAVIAYLIRYKFNEIILIPGRYFITKSLDENLGRIKESPEKDSLKILIKDYVSGIKKVDKFSGNSIGEFEDSIKIILTNDSVITNDELNDIKELIKRNMNK
ncbi:MAG: hypothetical protein ACYDA4_10035 [Ignavibacteriaceae bacterium]